MIRLMFTGIIEETGEIKELRRANGDMILGISAKSIWEDLKAGDSLAVQGVCLTVTSITPGMVFADVSMETMERSNLSSLRAGDEVNLERSLRLNDRMGGHIVLGHVDGTGIWEQLTKEGRGWRARIRVPETVEPYLVEKGSVAVDGVSLTVASLQGYLMSVAIIPHTMNSTTLRLRRPGDKVNLEADIIGKYVYRYLSGREAVSDRSGDDLFLKKLQEGGFLA